MDSFCNGFVEIYKQVGLMTKEPSGGNRKRMRKVKFITVQVLIILVMFFWDIGSIFSDRKGSHPVQPGEPAAISRKIRNEMSTFEETERMDRLITSFLKRYKIKGASVAVTKDGRLVYAKGFGYANEENEEHVEPGHIFRMASISKLITAVAVMQLVEEGKFSLDSKVFGPDGILSGEEFLEYNDRRIERITVRHLLEHKAGWSKYYGDPVFMPHVVARKMKVSLPVEPEDVIRYALTRKLSYTPGTRYVYSNLGYLVLGEVIEEATRMGYEDYVKLSLLNPLGIWDMQIGKGYYHEKAPNEVKYYETAGGKEVLAFDSFNSYTSRVYGGNDISLLGAAGGWIGSPAEVLKLSVAIDGFNSSPDILMPETIETMTLRSRSRGHIIGWKGSDGNGTWWRTGTLTGSSALMVRQGNGINWIIVMNTTTSKKSHIHRESSRTMFKAVNSVKNWPEFDLFDQQLPAPVQSNYFTMID
jgi:CubicO group peptidase (beta-lactamase class C family)